MVKVFSTQTGCWHNPSGTLKHEMLYAFFACFITPAKNSFARRNSPDEFPADSA
jgi:hypothetical protein